MKTVRREKIKMTSEPLGKGGTKIQLTGGTKKEKKGTRRSPIGGFGRRRKRPADQIVVVGGNRIHVAQHPQKPAERLAEARLNEKYFKRLRRHRKDHEKRSGTLNSCSNWKRALLRKGQERKRVVIG